jgi:hypothetical protein
MQTPRIANKNNTREDGSGTVFVFTDTEMFPQNWPPQLSPNEDNGTNTSIAFGPARIALRPDAKNPELTKDIDVTIDFSLELKSRSVKEIVKGSSGIPGCQPQKLSCAKRSTVILAAPISTLMYSSGPVPKPTRSLNTKSVPELATMFVVSPGIPGAEIEIVSPINVAITLVLMKNRNRKLEIQCKVK